MFPRVENILVFSIHRTDYQVVQSNPLKSAYWIRKVFNQEATQNAAVQEKGQRNFDQENWVKTLALVFDDYMILGKLLDCPVLFPLYNDDSKGICLMEWL